ncbi:hypothetical protein GGH92_006832 [Coemansia sp. RSA 2673]|nr:hypothetical protein H4S03_001532 [Coemansia sp. S3946]KAJ2339184.1 hypothetical protein GGH92_006832 [Coemansia sp. RSA 2673]
MSAPVLYMPYPPYSSPKLDLALFNTLVPLYFGVRDRRSSVEWVKRTTLHLNVTLGDAKPCVRYYAVLQRLAGDVAARVGRLDIQTAEKLFKAIIDMYPMRRRQERVVMPRNKPLLGGPLGSDTN